MAGWLATATRHRLLDRTPEQLAAHVDSTTCNPYASAHEK